MMCREFLCEVYLGITTMAGSSMQEVPAVDFLTDTAVQAYQTELTSLRHPRNSLELSEMPIFFEKRLYSELRDTL